jgi:glutamate formiminotransferase
LSTPIVECVPNFSEGRNENVLEAIAQAIKSVNGAHLLAREKDADHHRSVFTIAGQPDAVSSAVFQAIAVAVASIDLNQHQGVHPRIGAADVVPFIPVQDIGMNECALLAHNLGKRLWSELRLPVYFYESAALRPERRLLEAVRKGGFEQLRVTALEDPARTPDIGGPGLHPTAGAVIVGARKFLLAFNINLTTSDVQIARRIAVKIRASSGGLPHVKAMGVMLASRGIAQVSMNLTDYEVTPLHVVYEAVRTEASLEGVSIAGSEIIGLMPAAALAQSAAHWLQCENYSPAVIFEKKLLLVD